MFAKGQPVKFNVQYVITGNVLALCGAAALVSQNTAGWISKPDYTVPTALLGDNVKVGDEVKFTASVDVKAEVAIAYDGMYDLLVNGRNALVPASAVKAA